MTLTLLANVGSAVGTGLVYATVLLVPSALLIEMVSRSLAEARARVTAPARRA